MRNCWLAAFAAVSALSLAVTAFAQPVESVAAAGAKLAGQAGNEWVFTKVIVFMGPGNRCSQGEALRFLPTRQVVIEECEAGVMSRRPVAWSLAPNGPLDPMLSFDGKTYLVSFRTDAAHHANYMRLRLRGATATDLTTDREYRLSDDD
jgi:hypothetical protein